MQEKNNSPPGTMHKTQVDKKKAIRKGSSISPLYDIYIGIFLQFHKFLISIRLRVEDQVRNGREL
jgi:hypothetical protein